jgi:hypothetical protein
MTIHVVLLDEGTWCTRATEYIDLRGGLFRLLPTPTYDPEDEHWQFPPGSIVYSKSFRGSDGDYLLAVSADQQNSE